MSNTTGNTSFKRASIKIGSGSYSTNQQQQTQPQDPLSSPGGGSSANNNLNDNNSSPTSSPSTFERRKVTFGSSRKTFINTETSSNNLNNSNSSITDNSSSSNNSTSNSSSITDEINFNDLNLDPVPLTRPRANRSKTMVQTTFMGKPRATFSAKPTDNSARGVGGLKIGGRVKSTGEDELLVDVSTNDNNNNDRDPFEKVNLDDKKTAIDSDDSDDDYVPTGKQISWASVLNKPKPSGAGSTAGGTGKLTIGSSGTITGDVQENEPTSRRGTFRKAIVLDNQFADGDDTVDQGRLSSLDLATVQRPKQQYHTIDPSTIPQWKKNNEDLVQTYDNNQNNHNTTTSNGNGLISNVSNTFTSLLNRSPISKPAPAQSAGRTRAEAEYLEYLQRARESTFPEIESLNFIYQAGKDNLGRTIVVVIASNLPVKQTDMDRVLLYTISVMDPVVDGDYVLVYVHTNISNENKPSFAWLKKVYTIFNRKYKKNLKGLYIVHPTTWIKFTLRLFKPFISSKFWRKLTYIEDLGEIFKFFSKDQLNLPQQIMMYRPAGRRAQPIFGAPLEEVINRPDNPGEIPILFEKGITYLEKRGLRVEGIFRLSGASSQIKSLKKCFDSGEEVDFEDCEDVHTVAGLLKLYLRELPQPLFPFDTYSSFIEVARGDLSKEQKIESIKLLLSFLPPSNKSLSRHLFRFLDKVIQNSDANKMNAVNLSIVFAPNILRDQDNNVMNVVTDAQYVNQVIQLLLENIKTVVV